MFTLPADAKKEDEEEKDNPPVCPFLSLPGGYIIKKKRHMPPGKGKDIRPADGMGVLFLLLVGLD